MKTIVLFMLLILAVSPVYADTTDLDPKAYRDCDSVGTGDDAADPLTPDVEITGLYNFKLNTAYYVTGGSGNYTFSATCVDIDPISGIIKNTNNCCSDTITVNDDAVGEDSMLIQNYYRTMVAQTYSECDPSYLSPLNYSCSVVFEDTVTSYFYFYVNTGSEIDCKEQVPCDDFTKLNTGAETVLKEVLTRTYECK